MKYLLLVLSFYLISGIVTGQVEQGLVAKYYFNNESFEDEIGEVDGTPINVIFTNDRFNNPFSAIRFIPDNQSAVSFGDNFDELFANADGAFCFSFWMTMSDPEINGTILITKYGNSNCGEDQREFFIRIGTNNKIGIGYYSSLGWDSYRIIESSSSILDTLWHHIVINYNSTIDENDGLDRLNFYIDNELQETTLVESSGSLGDIQDGTAHFGLGNAIGSYGNLCGSYFHYGNFDDFRIYDRILNSEEVDTLYNEMDPFMKITENSIAYFNLNNLPNPFSTSTTIEYELQQPEKVTLTIYDHMGKQVYQTQENQPHGKQQLIWNAESYADGIYYYRLQIGDEVANGKIVKVR